MNRPVPRKPDLLGRLKALCRGLPPIRCAVVHPCDDESVAGANEAAKAGLITPVLVGPQAKRWI